MRSIYRLATPFFVLSLAACAQMGPDTFGPATSQAPTPQVATAKAAASIDVSAFIAPAAVGKLTAKDKTEAASAQFFALQFGRPGAPRMWQGGTGNSGKITVGPYVRVNDLDCRDFTHVVTVGSTDYTASGLACREQNGTWSVVDLKTAS